MRLTARPDPWTVLALQPGTSPLPLPSGSEGLLQVPPGLVLVLHSAGGTAEHGLSLLRGQADARGLVLLAPASAGATWDAIAGTGTRDTAAIDAALQHVLAWMPLPADRQQVGGGAPTNCSDLATRPVPAGRLPRRTGQQAGSAGQDAAGEAGASTWQ